jgi:hypothetical protein
MRDMFARAGGDFQHAAFGGQNFTQHLKHRIAIARGGGREQPVPVIRSILQRYRLFLAFIARHLVMLSHGLAFVGEPSPTKTALRSVRIFFEGAGTPVAYVAGDEGTILRRGASTPWERLDSGVTQRLNALEKGSTGALFAVGDHGTALRLEPGGTWTSEKTGVDGHLRAVVAMEDKLFAAGDGGTMIERLPGGRWIVAPTGVATSLRGLWVNPPSTMYVVGEAGTILRCELREYPPECVTIPSPTDEDLFSISEGFRRFTRAGAGVGYLGLVTSASGQILEAVNRGRRGYGWQIGNLRAPGALFAITVNHWLWFTPRGDTDPEPVAVGAKGNITLVTGLGVVNLTLPGGQDLYGVDSEEFDILAVGAGGAIVHGVALGVRIPIAVPD